MNIDYKINTVALDERLLCMDLKNLTLHSIFEHTVNFICDANIENISYDKKLLVSLSNKYLSPLTILTANIKDFKSEFYQTLPYNKFNLLLNPIKNNNLNPQSLKLKNNADKLISIKNNIGQFLVKNKDKGFIFNLDLNYIINDLQAENFSGLINSTIGLGIGLTPSGDDFICGILWVMHQLRPSLINKIKISVEKNLYKTTDISKFMLIQAISGYFSLNLLNLNPLNLAPILDYGHSSGHDTLTGIYIALQIYL